MPHRKCSKLFRNCGKSAPLEPLVFRCLCYQCVSLTLCRSADPTSPSNKNNSARRLLMLPHSSTSTSPRTVWRRTALESHLLAIASLNGLERRSTRSWQTSSSGISRTWTSQKSGVPSSSSGTEWSTSAQLDEMLLLRRGLNLKSMLR
jgi:hypothetical protein